MRKFKLLFSICCLSLGLIACGSDTEEATTGKTIDATAEKVTTEDGTVEDDTAEDETDSPENITAKQEIKDATWNSGMVQINNKIIKLPVRLSEFVEMGADYKVYKKREQEKTYLLADGESVSVDIVINGENIAGTMVTNDTGDFITVGEMDPLIYNVWVETMPENTVMFFPGGLTVGDPYKQIQDVLGKATEVDADMNYKYGLVGYSDHLGMIVSVDKNTQVISKIEIQKDCEINKIDSLTEIEVNGVKNLGTSIVNKITLSWMSDYREFESGFSNAEKEASRGLTSFVWIEDKVYKIDFSFMMFGAEGYVDVQNNGEKIFSATTEKGISYDIFERDGSYVISYLSEESVLKGSISCNNIIDTTEVSKETFKNLVFEIAKSIDFKSVE